MNIIILSMILAVTTFEYLTQIDLLPRAAKFTPEVLSAIVALLVLVYGTRNRFQFVRPAYWLVFGAIVVTMVCGAVANSVDAGPLFSGMRRYLRPMPLFFLAAAYAFSERQIRSQLMLLLVLCLPQFPIALSQRLARTAQGGFTGDTTTGMLSNSGFLSIFLVCAACLLTAAFLRKRIRLAMFFPLFLLVLLPTTLNETKATVILLPAGLLVTFMAASAKGARLKNFVIATSILATFGVIFVAIYDSYAIRNGNPTILQFYTDREVLEKYSAKDAEIGTSSVRKVGRVDALLIPLREIARDPTYLAFGLGIGNASASPLGKRFSGAYSKKFEPFLMTAASIFILELGALGLALVLLTYFLIYQDARVVADAEDDLKGVLALGWMGVTAVIVLATFYKNILFSETISYLFWYFSGVVAAHRVRLARRSGISAPNVTNSPARLRPRPA